MKRDGDLFMMDRAVYDFKGFLALLLIAAAGYGFLAGSFPVSSHAQVAVSGQLKGRDFYDAGLLDVFYQEQGMRPVWLRGFTTFQPRAEAVVDILKESWTHGLNPEKYHVSRLSALLTDASIMNRYEFDLLLSDAVIRYVRDLTGMRGSHAPSERAVKYWRQPLETEAILKEIALSADPVARLRALEPGTKLYQALRHELMTLTRGGGSAPIAMRSSLRPGQSDKAVPALREKLGLKASDSLVYDDDLAAAVMKFQRQNSLTADGVLGPKTMAIVNRDNADKIVQLVANMERLRWMEQGRPDRYVLVNIPSASLWAVDQGKVALEMPVIVGKTARPTYSFKTEITGVRLNPNWTVPPTIKKADFLPMLQEDPYVLSKRGISIHYNGQKIDPAEVDWSNVGSRGLHDFRMTQSPGADNPLGKVRVIMENPYNIYLHDTNHPEMFAREERTLSSGCVRVSQPEKLAEFILKNNDGWRSEALQQMISSGRMRDIPVKQSIPVYITYQTIWLDSQGSLVYGRDVYGQDAKLAENLKRTGDLKIPFVPEADESAPMQTTQINLPASKS